MDHKLQLNTLHQYINQLGHLLLAKQVMVHQEILMEFYQAVTIMKLHHQMLMELLVAQVVVELV
jgi:hypothetical protein